MRADDKKFYSEELIASFYDDEDPGFGVGLIFSFWQWKAPNKKPILWKRGPDFLKEDKEVNTYENEGGKRQGQPEEG